MWPKILVQLMELLPHVSRLVPVADRFFAAKTQNEQEQQAALAAIAEEVRADLGKVTAAHEGFYRQLQGQAQQIATAAADAQRARVAMESHNDRMEHLEKEFGRLTRWVQGTMALLIVVLGLLVVVLLRLR